jgi:hypothetical protein
MKTASLHAEDLTERRFNLMFLFLRIGGIPINRKGASCLRFLYNTMANICMYNLYLEFTMDVISRRDLEYGIVKVRFFLVTTVVMWMQLYLR